MRDISTTALTQLTEALGTENIRRNEPMKLHTTMEVGGAAAWFFTPEDEAALLKLIKILKQEKIPYYVLGKGSNIICRDSGYNGAIISLTEHFTGYRILREDEESAEVSVRSGMLNKDFSDAMIERGLSGFEFASGIPGSIGGATAMNAGAYDGEMKQIVTAVRLLNDNDEILDVPAQEMDFSYRHSLVSDTACVVLETVMLLKKDKPSNIQAVVDELTKRREEKQPLEYPSCGSTFKRPEGYFAGKLISDADLKGYRLGGAQVSEKHAGFVINRDNASAQEILDLIAYVQKTVKETSGVELECEVKILG